MNAISRRGVIRSSSLLLAAPFSGALFPAMASVLPSQPAPSPTLSTDLTTYLQGVIAPISARKVSAIQGARRSEFKLLARHQRHFARHVRSIAGFDAQVKTAASSIIASGSLQSPDSTVVKTFHQNMLQQLQAVDPTITLSKLTKVLGPVPTAQDFNSALKFMTSKGLTGTLKAMSSQLRGSMKDEARMHRTNVSAHRNSSKARLLRVQCTAKQKAEFNACTSFWYAMALLISGIGLLACALVVACAAALATLAGAGIAVGSAGVIVGLLALIIHTECDPLLVENQVPDLALSDSPVMS